MMEIMNGELRMVNSKYKTFLRGSQPFALRNSLSTIQPTAKNMSRSLPLHSMQNKGDDRGRLQPSGGKGDGGKRVTSIGGNSASFKPWNPQ
jgi:hypothetical protein